MLSLSGLEAQKFTPQSVYGLGVWGEFLIAETLTQAGYSVIHHPKDYHSDLRVQNPHTGQIWLVEVKTARPAKDKKWRYTLWKKGSQTHLDSDFVVLVAVTNILTVYPFVIPTSILRAQNQAVITSHPTTYKGKLSPFRQILPRLNLEVC